MRISIPVLSCNPCSPFTTFPTSLLPAVSARRSLNQRSALSLSARRTMRTREAVLPDAERIHKLISSYSGYGTLLPRTLAEICENVRDFVVLEDGGEIMGCGALHLYGPHLAEIRSITVDRSCQGLGGGKRLVRALDRKSTRLNSSHVSISYAVFCL